MKLFFYLLPILCGIAIAIQAIVNGQLRVAVGSPLFAALISFLVGTLFLVLLIAALREPAPSVATLQQIGWVKWTGGLLGAFFVTAVIVSVQKIPSANLFALIITSQFLTALLIDHFGLFGALQANINGVKIAGAVLLICGAYLIIKK